MKTIRFGRADLESFSVASHDTNPLHLQELYARKTPFGEPVVFGILGVLHALGAVPDRRGDDLTSVAVNFRSPLFMGVDYLIDVAVGKKGQFKASISDGGQPMMTATFTFREIDSGARAGEVPAASPRTEAIRHDALDLREGLTFVGDYAPEPVAFRELLARCGLGQTGNAASPIAALLWSSYLVGMELPGERAIFSRLRLKFAGLSPEPAGPMTYRASIASFDERFDLLETKATLTRGGQPFAEAEVDSYVRADSPKLSLDQIAVTLPPSDSLRGRTAMVIGGSRGLGAAIVASLASQGCDVVLNYRSSHEEVTALAGRLPDGWGTIIPAPGDASDPEWSARWLTACRDRGGLDVLVCNAVPPARTMPFGPDTVGRLRHYVDSSLALTATPLATFGPMVEAAGGWAVIVSSIYASEHFRELPGDLHHYVAAKHAVEGLARSLSASSPKTRTLIVRPPRLLTDQTNSVTGRQGAIAVEGVAGAIVDLLIQPWTSANLAVLEDFADGKPHVA